MINALRFNLFYLNLFIFVSIIFQFDILIIILLIFKIGIYSYRSMLFDLNFTPFDGLSKNFLFEDMLEYTSYDEFDIETSDFDGFFNYENYALNGAVFLADVYGGEFALNWEDYIVESFRFPLNNLNNLKKIYSDIFFTNFNYSKIFNKEYNTKNIFFDYIFLYDYYYYHRKSFENSEFDFKNEKNYYNNFQSIFLNEDYYNIHLNNNEINLISFNNFILLLKSNIKKKRLK